MRECTAQINHWAHAKCLTQWWVCDAVGQFLSGNFGVYAITLIFEGQSFELIHQTKDVLSLGFQ